jgi:hypothetical protein
MHIYPRWLSKEGSETEVLNLAPYPDRLNRFYREKEGIYMIYNIWKPAIRHPGVNPGTSK